MIDTVLMVIRWVMVGLAVWRFTYLLVEESGPFEVMDYIRHWVGVRYTVVRPPQNRDVPGILPGDKTITTANNTFAELFTCMRCMSFWVTLFFMPAIITPLMLPHWLLFTYEALVVLGSLWAFATLLVMAVERLEGGE